MVFKLLGTHHRQARTQRRIFITGMALAVGSVAFAESWPNFRIPKPKYEVTPYIWIPVLKGDVGPETGPTVPVRFNYSSLKELMNGGYVAWDVRWSHFSLLGDVCYNQLTDSTTAVPLPTPIPASATLKASVFSFAAGIPLPAPVKGMSVRVIGGFRIVSLNLLGATRAPLPAATLFHSRPQYVDPFVGFRTDQKLNEKVDFTVIADIGGFHTQGSRWSYDLWIGTRYKLSPVTAIRMGYRSLAVDYQGDGSQLAGTIQGFNFGVSFSF